jgi:hypothetical protein
MRFALKHYKKHSEEDQVQPTLLLNLSCYLKFYNLIIFLERGSDVSRRKKLIIFYLNVPTSGSVTFPPSNLFPPLMLKKGPFPLLSMWSNSSTPLKLAVGGHRRCGIHKSNFVCYVRSTKATDATKREKKRQKEYLRRI